MEASTSKKRLCQTTIDESFPSKRMRGSSQPLASSETVSKTRKAGFINKMILKNFMCHSCLEVSFVNNTSIIIGQNGSGKSAILTALVVGLGGKANLTNRGSSIKGFVKVGKLSSTIEIVIHNDGPMAYKKHIYGNVIIVIRHFTASGSSSYKIKNHSGQLVTTQAREVNNLTRYLNIQIDNPVCLLNQDTSRNFLSTSNPKHKYTLFVKATKLDYLLEQRNITGSNLLDASRLLTEKYQDLKELKVHLSALREKVEQQKSLTTLKLDTQNMHIELLWSKVKDAEDILEEQQQILNTLNKKIEVLDKSKQKRTVLEHELRNSLKEINNNITLLTNSMKEQSKPYQELKKTLDGLMNVQQNKDRELQDLKNKIRMKKRDIKVLEQDISQADQKKIEFERKQAEKEALFEETQQKIKSNNEILETSKNDEFQLKCDIAKKQDDERTFQQEVSDIDRKMRTLEEKLDNLQHGSGNSLLIYGRQIPRVLELINQNRKNFREIPRGPLGHYIKLKDKKWAVAAEGYLGASILNSFIVDNKADNQLLVKIFQQAGLDKFPTIITSKFFNKVHDVSPNLVRAPRDCVSLFNILEIEDVVVTNCIIDESSVEGILLIPTDTRAIELLSNSQNVPQNCRQGVTIKGDRYYPDPNYKTYCSTYHHARFLQVDTSEYKKNIQNEIEGLKSQKRAVNSQWNLLKNEMNIQKSKQQEIQTKIAKLREIRNNLRDKLDELRAKREEDIPDVQVLSNELEDVKTILNDCLSKFEVARNESQELQEKTNELQVSLTKLKKEVDDQQARIPAFQEKLREKECQLNDLSTSDEYDSRKRLEIDKKLEEHRVGLVTKQNRVTHFKEEAEQAGLRPDKIRNVVDLTEKIAEVQRTISRIEANSSAGENSIEQYQELKEKYDSVCVTLTELNNAVKECQQANKMRNKVYNTTKDYFVTYIEWAFTKVLQIGKFEGSLKIDVDAKTLDINVVPRKNNEAKTSITNLSGGERSFSTVAFLYSLWQCLDLPFYFLDEFDVYMDNVNRKKIFDILLHHAKTKADLQFVFLTPQDISFLGNEVSILRLENPERYTQ